MTILSALMAPVRSLPADRHTISIFVSRDALYCFCGLLPWFAAADALTGHCVFMRLKPSFADLL